MALDATTLALCAEEIKETLLEARIDKIFEPTRDEVILWMRTRTDSYKLLLSARSGSARMCFTQENYENPSVPPSFCMLLRKYLIGGRLVDVRTIEAERIVFLDFLCTNEMGDLVKLTLAVELMGRYCNLVLVSEKETVIDALKRVDFEDSEIRQLLPGLPYVLPNQPDKASFISTSFDIVKEKLKYVDNTFPKALAQVVGGLGPVVNREICYRAFGSQEKLALDMDEASFASLEKAFNDVKSDFEAGGRPNLVRRIEDSLPIEFSFTPLTQYSTGATLEFYDSFSDMLEAYYAEKDRVERLRQKSKMLRKTVQNMLERSIRKHQAREQDLAKSEKSDYLREYGELITANLHTLKKGDTKVTLENWYTGEPVEVPLNVRLTPSANAQKYFKEYKKQQTAHKMLGKLIKEGEHEQKYLETVLYEIDAAQGEPALEEIRSELKSQGYLKHYKPKNKKPKKADFLRFQSSDGFLILVGRNNVQNEKLTLKTARGKDMWFHIKEAPGSHVVVMSEGEDIPITTQNEAAMLAVMHSSLKNSSKVPVDYTQVKNIRKTNDLPVGMVLYDHYETAFITPEEDILKNIEKII